METTTFLDVECKKAKPTKKHVAAIWEGILGTVNARNAAGEAKYFDYDYEGARQWAGVNDEGADPRLWRNWDSKSGWGGAAIEHGNSYRYSHNAYPSPKQYVLWVKRGPQEW